MALASDLAAGAEHTKDSVGNVKKAIHVVVRKEGEWKDGHFKNARHLALSHLKAGEPAEKAQVDRTAWEDSLSSLRLGEAVSRRGGLAQKQ